MMKPIEQKLDRLFSRYVRERAGWKCEKCGSQGAGAPLHCHHILRRAVRATRWAPINGVCLCAKCHFWAGKEIKQAREWAEQYLGEECWTELVQLHRMTIKRTNADLEILALELA